MIIPKWKNDKNSPQSPHFCLSKNLELELHNNVEDKKENSALVSILYLVSNEENKDISAIIIFWAEIEEKVRDYFQNCL